MLHFDAIHVSQVTWWSPKRTLPCSGEQRQVLIRYWPKGVGEGSPWAASALYVGEGVFRIRKKHLRPEQIVMWAYRPNGNPKFNEMAIRRMPGLTTAK